MPMFKEPFKNLEKKFKYLEKGKVVSYFSESKEEINHVKSFYDCKYHILGPTFIEDKNEYVITFVYDKKRVIVPGGHPNA